MSPGNPNPSVPGAKGRVRIGDGGEVDLRPSAAAADDAELRARAETILGPAVDQVLRHARVWAQIAGENPAQRTRCVALLAGDLHRNIDGSARQVMGLLAELALRLAERERVEAPT